MAITYAVGQRLTATLLQTLADYTVNKAYVRLVQQSGGTTTLNNNTETAITFGTGSTVYDTHDFHSESSSTSRITPNIAGLYELRGTTYFSADTDYITLQCQPRLNGANYATAQRLVKASTATADTVQALSFGPVLIPANGTTDYFEMMGLQANSGAGAEATFVNSTSASVLECKFVQPLL